MRQVGWQVWLDVQHIDTVFFQDVVDVDEVRDSLVNHDGYPGGIIVRCEGRR